MYQVWVIDDEGFFTGDSFIVRKILPCHVTTPIPNGLIKPKWQGGWIEGATEEEIQAYYDKWFPPKDLNIEKTKLIVESKKKLEEWLYIHPMRSEIKYPEGEYYAVTQEKQSLLTQSLLLFELAQKSGIAYTTTWNSVGKECEVWSVEELIQLSFQMTEYVVPRVKIQQKYETVIMACTTEEELSSVVLDYDLLTVKIGVDEV